MSQNLPVGGFNWVENTYQFNKDFIKTIIYNKDNDEGYFLEVDVQYRKRVHDFPNGLLLLPKE